MLTLVGLFLFTFNISYTISPITVEVASPSLSVKASPQLAPFAVPRQLPYDSHQGEDMQCPFLDRMFTFT
jgi:hypothetical protein